MVRATLCPTLYTESSTTEQRSRPVRYLRIDKPLRSARTLVARTGFAACFVSAMVACGGGGDGTAPLPVEPTAIPVTGTAVAELASFDRVLTDLMKKWGIPGGAIAVVKDGRLVLARGYGYSDAVAKEPVAPDALFRIASVSKPITAVAILRLAEQGKLDLDARAFAMLPNLTPPSGSTVDPRLADITIRQLLSHLGGWDRDRSYDPMFRSSQIAQALGTAAPASVESVIRYMRGQPLDFTPGERYAYSNFGYAVLGRIIERVAGKPYGTYVRESVLQPMGITRMFLGHSLPQDRLPGEVHYYDGGGLTTSVFPPGGAVPVPYGGFNIEAMDAHGGWVASAVDLARFITAVDGLTTRPDVLRPETIALMTAAPAKVWDGSPFHYAAGWLVRPAQGNWWHDGSLPGTSALIVRTGSGLAWAVLFNARSMSAGSTFEQEVDPAVWQAVGQVTTWPTHDLFSQYP
jgi:CubicO group peptidase (beta-lactamase class C family)